MCFFPEAQQVYRMFVREKTNMHHLFFPCSFSRKHMLIVLGILDKPVLSMAFWGFPCCPIANLGKGDLSPGYWHGNSTCVCAAER